MNLGLLRVACLLLISLTFLSSLCVVAVSHGRDKVVSISKSGSFLNVVLSGPFEIAGNVFSNRASIEHRLLANQRDSGVKVGVVVLRERSAIQ